MIFIIDKINKKILVRRSRIRWTNLFDKNIKMIDWEETLEDLRYV